MICAAAQLIDIEANRDVLEEIFDKFITTFYGFDEQLLNQMKNAESVIITDHGDENKELDHQPHSCNGDETLSLVAQLWSLFTKKETIETTN